MNLYNENNKKAAAWLRQLIADGLIPDGVVDERSIVDVRPADLVGFRQCHFFAGIAGWSLALQLAGVSAETELWTGSCPCQPFSAAGKRKGTSDPRHLWPEFRRLIAECNPPTVFGEQVASKDGREWLAGVRADLEALEYVVGAADLCSAGIGAPNIRQRIYWGADGMDDSATNGRQHSEAFHGSDGAGNCTRESWEQPGNRCSTDGGLADSNGEQTHTSDSRGFHTESCRCGGPSTDRLEVARLEQAGRCLCGPGESFEETAGRSSSELGGPGSDGVVGLVQPDGTGRDTRRSPTATAGHGRSVGPASGDGFWDDWRIVHFTDGKTRRIERGIEPLVARISGDLDMLRAYGNAINPWVAKNFIQAFIEAKETLRPAETILK